MKVQHACTGRRQAARSALVLLWVAVVFAPGWAEAQDRGRFLRWAYQDAAALATEVGPQVPALALGGAAVLAPASLFDAAIRDAVRESYEGLWAHYLDAANLLGEPAVVLPVSAIFATSLATGDARFQDAAFTSLQAVVYSGLVTSGLKLAVGRARPFQGEGPHAFDPFGGRRSFPSGHATAAFALVTPWVVYYPSAATYGLFVLSAGTALARIAHDRHWATDVLAGSAIGFSIGYWLSRKHQEEATRSEVLGGVRLVPLVGPTQIALCLRIPLG